MTKMEAIITAEHVSFSYRDAEAGGAEETAARKVLRDVSIQIEKGSLVAVLGHNGSGKSTLAKHMNAILLPQEGRVVVDGIDTADEDRIYDLRQKVGMVFQNPDNQIVATIVEEDVAFAPENLGVPPEEIRRRVDEALEAVHMTEYREHAPHQLSGGQKQRVAIAGIIAMRPQCIVLDEPTAMLDPHGRRQVMRTIRLLNEQYGITVILITHYMDEAAACDRVVVVNDGEILLDGSPKDVFSHVQVLTEVGLDVPQATQLAWELRRAGYTIPQDIITEDECVAALEMLLEENHVHHSM